MKRYLLVLVVLATASMSIAQSDGGPRGKKPKKAKGNHSNGRTQLGFAGSSSVLYSVDLANPVSADVPGIATAENSSSRVTSTTLMTPTGWGSRETFAFATVGGTPTQVYNDKPDLLGQFGAGFGDYTKWASVVGILNVNDLSKFNNLSASIIASRKVGTNGSVSVGALHLFADAWLTDAGESFYAAYSHAIRNSKFSYTVGIGSGRFYDNSEKDIETGKKAHGTAVFGSLAYSITNNVNVSAEWTGLNLAMSSSVRIKPKWPVLTFGVSDITRLSGDKPTFYAGLGQALVFNRKK
ncbi:hypothetical protein [Aridibaculum aurantiacum]|uniref:hypothetical protein n=1 Tax=Aridibaculum aurantiacum TaxID=2810307 RepID=UPI001A96B290|nr:hypothetical protein [Aridibaculum aurantiacum]